jgi:hypothetical protein
MITNEIMDFTVPNSVIDKTIDTTIKKYLYTIRNLTYQRTPVELLDNLFMGDFAKNSLFYYLKEVNGKNVVDYDEIRTDNFQHPDPGWDIMSLDNNLKIEVKSSIVPNVDRGNTDLITSQNLINKRDVKITASHNKGNTYINPESLESDIHVQIYFFNARTYRNGINDLNMLANEITTNRLKVNDYINIRKYINAKYFGFSLKQEIIDFKNYNMNNNILPTWTFSWTDRVYWKSPISKAHPYQELLNII